MPITNGILALLLLPTKSQRPVPPRVMLSQPILPIIFQPSKSLPMGGTYILTGEYATPTSCAAINDTFVLNFTPRPIANNATLALCEKTAGSGLADFTLTASNVAITGGAAGVSVSYHATLADAKANTNPLSSPYTSVAKTLYARVENTTTGCYRTATLTLNVNSKPLIADASTTICEGASVNLTTQITNYATFSNPVWTLTNVGGTAVATPTAVTPSVSTTYVLVAENVSGCKDTTNVEVTVNPLPVANTASATLCENTAGSGQATFDLTTLNPTVKGSASDVVTYHTTLADAQSGSNTLNALSHTSSATTIYARVRDIVTNCYSTSVITLNVNAKPLITDATTTICNGTTVNLTSLITNYGTLSNPVWTLSTVGGTSIPNPAAVVPNATLTYVLVAANVSGCKDTANVVVTVNPLPDFTLSKPIACPGTSEDVNITNLTNAVAASSELKIDAGAYAAYPSPATVFGLSVGNHTFTIKNENGCETAKNISISPIIARICLPVTVTRSIGSN